jgi:RNA polymerase sigma factor (sigma-70 family)
VPAQRTPLIQNGMFVGYLMDRETAAQIGKTSNATSRADGWNRIPMIRMSNVNLEPGNGGTLADLIADETERSPHQQAAQAMLRRHMDDAMQVLSPRERQVLHLRYGLGDAKRDHTLAEIAEVLGVSADDASSHAAFREKYQLPFTLLADTDREAGEAYGVTRDDSEYFERSTFVIDADGNLARVLRKVDPSEHAELVLAALPS